MPGSMDETKDADRDPYEETDPWAAQRTGVWMLLTQLECVFVELDALRPHLEAVKRLMMS